MIVKDADPIRNSSNRAQSGARAEKDMAFYLRRGFGDHRPDVFVFNDLRLQHDGDIAQIDHLVVHVHGMFVIESKSVSGEIHVLPDGQFVRQFGRGKQVGMASPVLQAHRQVSLLRRLLQANREAIRERKLLGMLQGGFSHCPIEVRVAISDRGIIRGDRFAPEVRKADLITQDIEERVAAHRRGGNLLSLDATTNDGMYRFTAGELERLQRFLLDQHLPRSASDQVDSETEVAAVVPREDASRTGAGPPDTPASGDFDAPQVQYLCSKCHSLDLQVLHGRYGYYFKCQSCGGNTWIDTRIDGTEQKGRIRKSGRQFFLVCPDSGSERLIFTNPKTND